ncbi:hypothetical protein ACB092_04G165500 [Castanea dentata]
MMGQLARIILCEHGSMGLVVLCQIATIGGIAGCLWGFDKGCGGFGLQLRRCSKLGISFWWWWWWWCCTLGLDLNRSEWRSSWYGVEVGTSGLWVAEMVMVGCW